MPFEEKAGWEDSNSKFCGVETDFSDDVSSLLYFNTDNGRFDFVLAPLVWYEWSVSLPTLSPIHNPNGSSCWMGL
ncbi:hypothetical protein ISN45_Aa04g003930 [Arabidopsis thaliana x Arabidopsis arenosa]|uniref:Uncharacterized protein n=1 Tax=Arabidopsis thaliana x Arabidopsis arenosa TaxID=1240361 RepID=A0A8T2A1V9_9BRAS|nr:hypothetical protein ISN45_Aa04g003930 [Arabidopsis thaliana x Arabidopsis arenosa]